MVKDINPWGSSNPRYLTVVDGTLFFQANDGIQGIELFSSDGTEFGTGMVMDIYPGQSSNPSHLFAMNGMLYFQANDGVAGIELWSSDGTARGTKMVCEINPWRGTFPPAPHGTEWEDEWEESSQ
jgi:ELWxxDGT repeat protein